MGGVRAVRSGLGCEVFSTGQVAAICRVAPRTVSKWFDSGRIKGYRIPASQDRRVTREELVRFLVEYRFPVPPALTRPAAVTITYGLQAGEAVAGAVACENAFAFALAVADAFAAYRPVVAVVGDADGLTMATHACRLVRHRSSAPVPAAVVLVLSEDAPAGAGQGLADRVLRRPLAWSEVEAAAAVGPGAD